MDRNLPESPEAAAAFKEHGFAKGDRVQYKSDVWTVSAFYRGRIGLAAVGGTIDMTPYMLITKGGVADGHEFISINDLSMVQKIDL